jgi:transposase, IS5 family
MAGYFAWAREKLVKLAKKLNVELRQSYRRLGKFALIKHQRYGHAKQFRRANRALRKLKTYLGRVIRDITRKIDGNPWLEEMFAHLLSLARRVLQQERGQRGPKVYSLHAPEVECIAKGKPHKPYEFGVKVSVATTLQRSKAGQFVAHVQALPGNPYDGHTLAQVIPAIEQLIGNTIERLHVDAGYRGHNAPPDYRFKIYTARQKRRLTPQIKREMRRRSAKSIPLPRARVNCCNAKLQCKVPLPRIVLGQPLAASQQPTVAHWRRPAAAQSRPDDMLRCRPRRSRWQPSERSKV